MARALVAPAGAAEPVTASREPALLRSPATVAALVLLFYAVWISAILLSGHDAREWINFGSEFADRPHAQQLMHVDPRSRFVRTGFGVDGEFYYFIAVDPVQAQYFMDDPAYRYKRIVYPMLARLLALGRWQLVPYTLILVNWLALGVGTLAIAAWLKRKGLTPWLAGLYGLYPGMLLSFQRDYTEPVAYALLALAVYLYDFGGKRQLLGASLCMALAALTRDKMLAFTFFLAAGILLANFKQWDRRARRRELLARAPRAALFGAVACLPVAAYELFLKLWLHHVPSPAEQLAAPFTGPSALGWDNPNLYLAFICVVMPSVVLTGMCLWGLWRGAWRTEVFALLVTIQLSVVAAHPAYWRDVPGGVMRLEIPMLMLALYCIPIFDRLNGRRRWWLWASAGGWMILVPVFALFGAMMFVESHL